MTNTDVDASNSDNAEDSANKSDDKVDRSELQKVITQRDELKEKYRGLQSNFDSLRSEFSEFKDSVEVKTRESHKNQGNVEELEKSFNSALQAEKKKVEEALAEVNNWKDKYTSTVVHSKASQFTGEHLDEAGSELFWRLHKDKLTLSDDGEVLKVKDDVRDLKDIVLEFSEKYGHKKNPAKAGMNATGNSTNSVNTSSYTKAQIEAMKPDQVRKLPQKVLSDYLANRLN
jgi:chromosome segregation ATPase